MQCRKQTKSKTGDGFLSSHNVCSVPSLCLPFGPKNEIVSVIVQKNQSSDGSRHLDLKAGYPNSAIPGLSRNNTMINKMTFQKLLPNDRVATESIF